MSKQVSDLRIWPSHLKEGIYQWNLDKVDHATSALWRPENPILDFGEVAAGCLGVAYRARNEAGEFKVDLIIRTPQAAPAFPYAPKIVQIFGRRCNHVEGVAEFMSTHPRWRYGILTLSAKVGIIKTLLLGVRSYCGCDSWLDPRTSCQIYEGLCIWLQGRQQITD